MGKRIPRRNRLMCSIFHGFSWPMQTATNMSPCCAQIGNTVAASGGSRIQVKS